jgi:hypothetical protein
MYDQLREDLIQAAEELDQQVPGVAEKMQGPIAIFTGEDPDAITVDTSRMVHHLLDYMQGFNPRGCAEKIQSSAA